MIPVTQEQVLETLERLRWYAQHFYYGPEARELLAAHTIEYEGKKFSISVRDDGAFEANVKDSGLKIIYETLLVTAVPSTPHSIDNLEFRVKVINKEDLSPEDAKWAADIGPFVLSAFQRTNAFIFLARSQDVTLAKIAKDLALLQPTT